MKDSANHYAIIKTGGKQYRVANHDIIDVELLGVEQGSQIEFGEVLFFTDGSSIQIGEPGIAEFVVAGEVLGIVPGEKINTMKYKPSRNQYRRFGHRQHYSRVKINFIGSRQDKSKGAKHGT